MDWATLMEVGVVPRNAAFRVLSGQLSQVLTFC